MKIVMIRHGLSEANIKRIISGSKETPLSEKGRDELLSLKDTLNYPDTDIYVASSLSRCVDTFNVLFPDKSLAYKDDRFKEISFGDIEGMCFIDYDLDEFFLQFFENKNVCNNELYEDFFNRITDGLSSLILNMKDKNYDSATVVAHSTVIKVLVKHVNNIENDEYKNIPMKNGTGYIFDIDLIDDKLKFNSVTEIK